MSLPCMISSNASATLSPATSTNMQQTPLTYQLQPNQKQQPLDDVSKGAYACSDLLIYSDLSSFDPEDENDQKLDDSPDKVWIE